MREALILNEEKARKQGRTQHLRKTLKTYFLFWAGDVNRSLEPSTYYGHTAVPVQRKEVRAVAFDHASYTDSFRTNNNCERSHEPA